MQKPVFSFPGMGTSGLPQLGQSTVTGLGLSGCAVPHLGQNRAEVNMLVLQVGHCQSGSSREGWGLYSTVFHSFFVRKSHRYAKGPTIAQRSTARKKSFQRICFFQRRKKKTKQTTFAAKVTTQLMG